MAVITESALRTELKNKNLDCYAIQKGDKITPSAMEYLKTKGIEIRYEEEAVGCGKNSTDNSEKSTAHLTKAENQSSLNQQKKYLCYYTGAWFSEKPEFMTHIEGNKLVYKDHPRLIFRGKLDSAEAQILYSMAEIDSNRKQIKEGLKEVYEHLRKIMRAEVLGEHLEEFSMLSYTPTQIREMSHHPEKYFGQGHFMLSGEEGKEVLILNRLRTQIRELELEAVKAFRQENNVERQDILTGLNRLSSALYVLMLKAKYEK